MEHAITTIMWDVEVDEVKKKKIKKKKIKKTIYSINFYISHWVVIA